MIIVHNLSLESLRQTFEARASEWMLTGATISLALIFFANESMFYRDTFEGLRNINSSRMFWIMALSIVGAVRFIVLVINGSHSRTPHFRALTAFLCSGIWFMFCAGFARNGSVMIAIVPWIFFLDSYNAKRAAREAGQSEFTHRYLKKKTQDLANAKTVRGSLT